MGWKAAAAAAAAAALAAAPAGAQEAGAFLPDVRHFRFPAADPLAPRISAGILGTNLLATQGPERPPFYIADPADAARDAVAAVSIGAIFPLLRLADREDGGLVLVADARVFSRFRIEYESRDDMGQDWLVGGGIEGRQDRWSGRAVIVHRSSHLGDEFVAATGAERIEFGSEQLDVLTAYDVPGVGRLYGGSSLIFRSYLGWDRRFRELGIRDRVVLQAGIDREWRPWGDRPFATFAGLDLQAAQRTDWKPGVAAAAGIGVRSTRSLSLIARWYDGPSTMSQFFLTPERYLTLELAAEF